MDQDLSIYLPEDRRQAVAQNTPLPEQGWGTALFADISGFTPLTEILTQQLGPRRGAEEVVSQINQVYEVLITEVERYGGSVVSFAGDAITCWFDGEQSHQAIPCAFSMQSAMSSFATLEVTEEITVVLSMKVGLAIGTARRFVVGDPAIQQIDVLTGALLDRMAAAERQARKGEVVLDEASVQVLATPLSIADWRVDELRGTRFAVLAAPHLPPPLLPQPSFPRLEDASVRPWLLPAIYERLRAGHRLLLTELRPAVALFLSFEGIAYDQDPNAGTKLGNYIRWVQHTVARYEGFLLDINMGDKGSTLYIAFGAPLAHEDDGLRAVLTARQLLQQPAELAYIKQARVGISQGIMRTGIYGSATRATYGVLGDEVNLAARLMQRAAPGEILASGRIQAATSQFLWQPLPPVHLKGKAQPIPLFTLPLTGNIASSPLHEPHARLPLIGRQAEMGHIEAQMAKARQGHGQIVALTGEAGIGKSRLLGTMLERAEARGFHYYGGSCYAYGTNIPYHVWQPIYRALFGLDDIRSGEQPLTHLAGEIAAVDIALLPQLPLLGSVVNLTIPESELTQSMEARVRKESLEALLVAYLRKKAITTPLLLVLEDCHWLDPLSHNLLERIGRALLDRPILILMAYRPPELVRLQRPYLSTLPNFTEIALEPLTPEAAAVLIAQTLPLPLPDPLFQRIIAQAQGNPFYLDELAHYLRDTNMEETAGATLDLPDTLHQLILSRLDQLSEQQQVMLRVASIIGRLFQAGWLWGYYPALGTPQAVRADLDAMSRTTLLSLTAPEPDLLYLFKHIITREVTYSSLPHAIRSELHEQLARYLESRYADQLEQHLDLLAYHYGHSNNSAKQREYFHRAGDAARRAYANDTALDYYQRLLPLSSEAEQGELLLAISQIESLMGRWETAESHCWQALSLAERHTLLPLQAHCYNQLGSLFTSLSHWDKALAALEQSRALWELLLSPGEMCGTLGDIAHVHRCHGNLEQAMRSLEQALEIATQVDAPLLLCRLWIQLGELWVFKGDSNRALSYYEAALPVIQKEDQRLELAHLYGFLGNLHTRLGDYPTAIAFFQQELSVKWEIGYQRGISHTAIRLSNPYTRQGEMEKAERCCMYGLQAALRLGDYYPVNLALTLLAEQAHRQKRYDVAERLAYLAVTLARSLKTVLLDKSLWTLARLRANQGHYSEALALTVELLQWYANTEMKEFHLQAQLLSLWLQKQLGQLSSEAAKAQLEHLLKVRTDEEEQAAIFYDLWQLEPSDETVRHKTATLYRALYERVPHVEYHARYEALTAEPLTPPPPLPDLPDFMLQQPILLEPLLRQIDQFIAGSLS